MAGQRERFCWMTKQRLSAGGPPRIVVESINTTIKAVLRLARGMRE
jgi:hypothetical protein